MCGRFARRSTREVLADWFGVELEDLPPFAPSYNVAPQSVQPVVREGRDSGSREFALLRWGLVPFWAKDAKIGYSTINARAEEAAAKPAFREALRKRRCLIPADAFYEWAHSDPKNKRPFAIALRSGEPYAFAGIWERWRPKEGEALETFSILTTDANEVVEPVHNRMPVILEPKEYDRWLEPGSTERLPVDLLRPFPAERMIAWPVSDRVGNVRNNDPELLVPRE
jgi:putative SOS response-associated peptidase YedK